jgi:hypothetical protein
MGLTVLDYAGLFAPGNRRGDDDVIPGRRGQVGAQLPYDAFAFSVPVAFAFNTDTFTNPLQARRLALMTLANLGVYLTGTNGLVTLTRRLSSDDAEGYTEHTASGRYVAGTAVAFLNPYNWTTELQFINLDGAWFDGTDWIVP